MPAKKEYVNISIPKKLYKNVEKSIDGTGFRSVTEFIVFITREMVISGNLGETKKRLEALGYFERGE